MKKLIPFMVEMGKLKESSKHAVVDGGTYSLDTLKEHLHVDRQTEKSLSNIIIDASRSDKAQLILVCGNVGDGKSHVLSHLNDKITASIGKFKIHNDATESFNPDESFIKTLLTVLENFKDEQIGKSADKVILAINLGTLNNFLDEEGAQFTALKKYVADQGILNADEIDRSADTYDKDSYFQHINFTDYQLYSLTEKRPKSHILSTLLKKLTRTNDNPLFLKYKEFARNLIGLECPICYNFEFLMEDKNREAVVQLMIAAIIKSKEIISLRFILNFIYDIIIPIDYQIEDLNELKAFLNNQTKESYIRNILPNYLFEHPELSKLFHKISFEDPCNFRSSEADENIISIVNAQDIAPLIKRKVNSLLLKDNLAEKLMHIRQDKKLLTKTYLRLVYFNDMILSKHKDSYYDDFTKYLFHFNRNDRQELRALYSIVTTACINWNGRPNKNDRIIVDIGLKQSKYRILTPFNPKENPSLAAKISKTNLDKFNPQIIVSYGDEGEKISLHIDYGLFKLLVKVGNGYRPNKLDKQSYINFISFLEKLIANGDKNSTIEIDEVNIGKNVDYSLSFKPVFDEYKFEIL